MLIYTRRKFIARAAEIISVPTAMSLFPLLTGCSTPVNSSEKTSESLIKEIWINNVVENSKKNPTKGIEGFLELSKFLDTMYFLNSSTKWKSNYTDQRKFSPVIVPKGFVTDLASIPRIFFSALRPDGIYCHAAIIHDYLYWEQTRSREESDSIFEIAMKDTEVPNIQLVPIIKMVQIFGKTAWENNTRLRESGEKRILKKFPTNPTTRWSEWKKNPDVFV